MDNYLSDSDDTIILLSNSAVDEPSDSEIENILKKYSSTSTSSEFKESTSSRSNLDSTGISCGEFNAKNIKRTDITKSKKRNNIYSDDKCNYSVIVDSCDKAAEGDFSNENLIGSHLIKRPKMNGDNGSIGISTNQMNKCKSDRNKYSLEDYSDSDSDIKSVLESKNVSADYLDMDSEEIIRELNNKYLPSTSKSYNQKIDVVVLSDNSDTNESSHDVFPHCFDTFSYKVSDELTKGKQVEAIITKGVKDSSEESETEVDRYSLNTADKLKKQKNLDKKRNDKAREKERKREEVERKKAMRDMEKARKKEEAERQKAMKNALKSVEQSTKPDECIKYMIVELDSEILQKNYGEILKTTLNNNGISFKSTPQVLSNLVSWCRKSQSLENMVLKNTEVREKQFLLILEKKEYLQHIKKDTLTQYIQNISPIIQFKQLTIAIMGLEKMKPDHEDAITEAQILTNCYVRYVNNVDDLASLIMEVTKAIAQIPHKAKKEEKYKLQTEYFNDSNKDTVRVDKNGNGLGRLWQQMLTMFPLARLETAEAITAVYPTPDSLFKAYNGCQLKKEELLQDLPIRRALGPCISVRRIGPELSRKCSNFFCSTDNILL